MSDAPTVVDTHAHLMAPEFKTDLSDVLARATEAGVRAIVCVGYDLESSHAAVRLAELHRMCFASVGIHPNYAGQTSDTALTEIAALAKNPNVVAIGETGLDYYRKFTDSRDQKRWFEAHLELAAERSLPVVIHNREASDDVQQIVSEWAARRRSMNIATGVMHCFSGDEKMLDASVAAGFMISFAGPLTYRNAAALREVARLCPADRRVVETDCPYLAPHPRRGTRNEPAGAALVAQMLAELANESVEVTAAATTANAIRLFPAVAAAIADARGKT